MMICIRRWGLPAIEVGLAAAVLAAMAPVWAEEKADKKGHPIRLAEGRVTLSAPANWEVNKPRVRIIDFEFAIPKKKGDPRDGRVTVMGASGGVEANLRRWLKQFKNAQPKRVKGSDEIKHEMEIADQKVYVVDIRGTYLDRKGPFAPATPRENYRMLGAIIETGSLGHYFVKCYGPEKTIEENAEAFQEMLKTLQVKP